jgi:hypothetical protein
MNKLKCVQAVLAATTTQESVMQESKMKKEKKIVPFKFHTPHKENVMKLKYLSILLVIATAYDLPNTTAYTPWSATTRCNNCTAIMATAGLSATAKHNRKAKAEAKTAKAKVVKAAQAAEHRAMHSRGKEIATWLENRKVCTAPAASRGVRKARSLRAKAKAIANRAIVTADWVNPTEGQVPTWIKAPIGMITGRHPASKGKAQVRRMARYQASPWGRAKAEEAIARETARAHRRAVRAARLAEDRAIRLSREEARAAKAAQKAATKVAPKKGNAKRAYMAAIPAPTAIQSNRTIRCIAKVNGRVVATDILEAWEAMAYLQEQGYKPAALASTVKTATAPVVTVAPRVVAEATPAHAIKVATAAKADAVIAEFCDGNVKLFTVVALEAMVAKEVYDLAGNLNPDQKAELWAERQARQVKAEKVDKVKGAEAMFLKANPTYAEFKSRQNPKHTKPLMGQKVATVTQEETK